MRCLGIDGSRWNVRAHARTFVAAGRPGMTRMAATPPPRAGARRLVAADALPAGERLDRALAAALGDLSRSRIKALIEAGCVTAVETGATVTDVSLRVKAGQTFAVFVPDAAPAEPEAQALPLTILYEDTDIIVIDKPAGLVVHPAPGNPDHTLVNALIAHCGASLTGIGGVRRPGIVHRLDKDTSGLMVVAKSALAHADLTAQFAARSVERVYRAVVWGVPAPRHGEIRGAIGRDRVNRKKMAVLSSGGKQALTKYAVVSVLGPREGQQFSVVECRLGTGRTHQVRVHLAYIGHPLVGDRVYGGRGRASRAADGSARGLARKFPRQALDAYRLAFDHPRTHQRIKFTKALAADINALINSLNQL
jgi:23S rRNA pseudouridine1911/1915/1917 synthase